MDTTNKKDGIDTEYLISLLNQIKCKNNGIISHLQKKDFQINGMKIGESHLSFEYLREKSDKIDMLVEIVKRDVLIKTIIARTFNN